MAMASSTLGFVNIPSINIHGNRRISVRCPLFCTVKAKAEAVDVENNEMCVSTTNAKPWEVLFEKKRYKSGRPLSWREDGCLHRP